MCVDTTVKVAYLWTEVKAYLWGEHVHEITVGAHLGTAVKAYLWSTGTAYLWIPAKVYLRGEHVHGITVTAYIWTSGKAYLWGEHVHEIKGYSLTLDSRESLPLG